VSLFVSKYEIPAIPAVDITARFMLARIFGNISPVFLAKENKNNESVPVDNANAI